MVPTIDIEVTEYNEDAVLNLFELQVYGTVLDTVEDQLRTSLLETLDLKIDCHERQGELLDSEPDPRWSVFYANHKEAWDDLEALERFLTNRVTELENRLDDVLHQQAVVEEVWDYSDQCVVGIDDVDDFDNE